MAAVRSRRSRRVPLLPRGKNARVRCTNDLRGPAPNVKLRRSLPRTADDPRAPGRSPAAAVHRVKLVSRWTAADFSGGWVLLEDDDATAMTHFALRSDLLELRLVPVVEDAQLLDALGRAAA